MEDLVFISDFAPEVVAMLQIVQNMVSIWKIIYKPIYPDLLFKVSTSGQHELVAMNVIAMSLAVKDFVSLARLAVGWCIL